MNNPNKLIRKNKTFWFNNFLLVIKTPYSLAFSKTVDHTSYGIFVSYSYTLTVIIWQTFSLFCYTVTFTCAVAEYLFTPSIATTIIEYIPPVFGTNVKTLVWSDGTLCSTPLTYHS